MEGMIKKYAPYAGVIFAVYFLVPLIFMADVLSVFAPVAYYFIFPATAIICSALYCSKYGLDFLFSLIAPIIYIPSMLLFNGGFSKVTNIILLVAYLVSGILGLFIGDIALGDKRKEQEALEKAEAEEMLLEAKRRDEEIKEQLSAQKEEAADEADYDFDYGKYTSSFSSSDSNDDEIDAILNELRK